MSKTPVLMHKKQALIGLIAHYVRQGGAARRAADAAKQILFDLQHCEGKPSRLKHRQTVHGETRIEGASKYDLGGGYRLVVARQAGSFWVLTMGSHDDVEKWLSENAGLQLAIDPKTGELTALRSFNLDEKDLSRRGRAPARRAAEAPPRGYLLDALEEQELERLPVPRGLLIEAGRLPTGCDDDAILEVALKLDRPAESEALLSMLHALRDGEDAAARAQLARWKGEDVTPTSVAEVRSARKSGDGSENFADLSDLSPEELSRSLDGDFEEWMLFLHPEQERLVSECFPGPAVVTGPSGAGKTSILVHRAVRLAGEERAAKGRSPRIALLALNAGLSTLIGQLARKLSRPATAGRIEVMPFRELCHRILSHFEPARSLAREDPISKEDLRATWRDWFEKRESQRVLKTIIDSLERRGIDPSRYLQEEFLWVRTALQKEEDPTRSFPTRKMYAEPALIARHGREIPFSRAWRKAVIDALESYEDYLYFGGLIDDAALALEAHKHCEHRPWPEELTFTSILVDEFQDLGPLELDLLRRIAPHGTNTFYLTGDMAQQVYPKEANLKRAGLSRATRRRALRSFRNSRPITEYANQLLPFCSSAQSSRDGGLKPARPGRRPGPVPLLVHCENDEEEYRVVAALARAKLRRDGLPIGVGVCGPREDRPLDLGRVRDSLMGQGLEITPLREARRIESGRIYLAALESLKGFEFSLAVVMHCDDRRMPVQGTPPEEAWREARRLYVAATRARDELVITFVGASSPFLARTSPRLHETTTARELLAAHADSATAKPEPGSRVGGERPVLGTIQEP